MLYLAFDRAHAMTRHRGSGGIQPLILNLGTRWNFTPEEINCVPIEWGVVWDVELVWMFWRRGTCLATAGVRISYRHFTDFSNDCHMCGLMI
jgi:hypothetical protein